MPRTVEVAVTVGGLALRASLTASGGPYSVFLDARALGFHKKGTLPIADAEKAVEALQDAIAEAKRQRTMPL